LVFFVGDIAVLPPPPETLLLPDENRGGEAVLFNGKRTLPTEAAAVARFKNKSINLNKLFLEIGKLVEPVRAGII
jgi:hypothetical protein